MQVVMTASILYEAVEPQIVWKQLLNVILNELTGDGTQNEVRITPRRSSSNYSFFGRRRQSDWLASF